MSYCTSHPSEEVVGICASCLRERLYSLKAKKQPRRRSLDTVYSSESDSCEEIHEINSLGIQRPITDSYAVGNHEIIPRKKFLWMAAKSNKFQNSAQKKERRAFSALRSLFHRLKRSKEVKQNTCISHDDSFISIKLDGSERSSWVPQVLPSSTLRPCKTVGSSARSSISDQLSRPSWDLSRPSWDGMLSKRSSSYYEKEFTKRDIESHNFQHDYQQQEQEMTTGSSTLDPSNPVKWRTRMNGLFQMKRRMQESRGSGKMTQRRMQESRGSGKMTQLIEGLKDSNYHHHHHPASKIWSLSSLYNYNDSDHHCNMKPATKRATKKSWIKTLTSPKWSHR